MFLKISFYIGRIRIRIRIDNTGSGSEENIPDLTGSASATLIKSEVYRVTWGLFRSSIGQRRVSAEECPQSWRYGQLSSNSLSGREHVLFVLYNLFNCIFLCSLYSAISFICFFTYPYSSSVSSTVLFTLPYSFCFFYCSLHSSL